MKYAIDYRNMHNGIHGLLIYKSNPEAQIYLKCLKDYQDNEEMIQDIFNNCHGRIEEVNYRELKEVIKDVHFPLNPNSNIWYGDKRITSETSNMRIINYNQSIDLYL